MSSVEKAFRLSRKIRCIALLQVENQATLVPQNLVKTRQPRLRPENSLHKSLIRFLHNFLLQTRSKAFNMLQMTKMVSDNFIQNVECGNRRLINPNFVQPLLSQINDPLILT